MVIADDCCIRPPCRAMPQVPQTGGQTTKPCRPLWLFQLLRGFVYWWCSFLFDATTIAFLLNYSGGDYTPVKSAGRRAPARQSGHFNFGYVPDILTLA